MAAVTPLPREPMKASAELVTPEGVVIDQPVAGVGSRLVALLVDVAVLAVLTGLVLAIGTRSGEDPGLALTVASFAILLVVPGVVEWATGGRSIGKWLLGLRIVTIDGSPVTASMTATRSAMLVVDLYTTLGFVGLGSGLLTTRAQRVGDVVAGTMAVRERVPTTVPSGATAVRFVPEVEWRPFAASLDTTGVSAAEYDLLRRFLLRYPGLAVATRDSLAVSMAERIAPQVRFRAAGPVNALGFLTSVAAAYQLRTGLTEGVRYNPAVEARPRSRRRRR